MSKCGREKVGEMNVVVERERRAVRHFSSVVFLAQNIHHFVLRHFLNNKTGLN
jgi:hypothetical protein